MLDIYPSIRVCFHCAMRFSCLHYLAIMIISTLNGIHPTQKNSTQPCDLPLTNQYKRDNGLLIGRRGGGGEQQMPVSEEIGGGTVLQLLVGILDGLARGGHFGGHKGFTYRSRCLEPLTSAADARCVVPPTRAPHKGNIYFAGMILSIRAWRRGSCSLVSGSGSSRGQKVGTNKGQIWR